MTLRVTPKFITSLNPNEIFVFGSNLAGAHGGGAVVTKDVPANTIVGGVPAKVIREIIKRYE